MPEAIRVLHLEDNPSDAALIQAKLRADIRSCDIEWVQGEADFAAALARSDFDLVLSDFNLTGYNGMEALELAQSERPEAPVILLSGELTEEEAIACVNRGATDYVFKDRLERLVPAVTRALRESAERRRRLQAEAALRLNERRLQLALEASETAVWELDVESGALQFSRGPEPLLGFSADELPATIDGWTKLVHPHDSHHVADAIAHVLSGESPKLRIEYRIRSKQGSSRWLQTVGGVVQSAGGKPVRISGTHRDITDLKDYQAELEFRANHDWLTGLANRNVLADRIDHSVAIAERSRRGFGLLYLDLDGFKAVNDTLGHGAGDQLLQAVVGRLKSCVRDSDTVARLGGDEFAVVLHDIAQTAAAGTVAHKVLQEVSKPFEIAGREVRVSASIGVAIYPTDGTSRETLLANADTAMYRAKQSGRNQVIFYTAELGADAQARLELESDLRKAVQNDELELHYQPRVDFSTGAITAIEALVRWRRPGHGLVTPARFLPIAEGNGLIVPIGEWVLRTACAQMKRWRDAGHTASRVAVNLSARQLRQPDLAEKISAILREIGLESRYLELEIPEEATDDPGSHKMIEALTALGVAHTIDDFGTSFASLAYLKRSAVDVLKIDRSFVRGLPDNADDAGIVRSIIAIGHSLDIAVVAEGVETEGQRRFLEAHGCDGMQGYLHSRPGPVEDMDIERRVPTST
ncbi:MAG TPA: EAL domain-containing protein [Burkholderiales bacterium]|nr:EAL domain-containing protein [Burkholderiales bacterium]